MNHQSPEEIIVMNSTVPANVQGNDNGYPLIGNAQTVAEEDLPDIDQAELDLETKVRALASHLGPYEYCPMSRLNNAPHLDDIPRAAFRIFGSQPEIPIASIGGVKYIPAGMVVHMLCTALAEKAGAENDVEDIDGAV